MLDLDSIMKAAEIVLGVTATGACVVLLTYGFRRLSDCSDIMFCSMGEYRLNPQGRSFREILRDHKDMYPNPNYSAWCAQRLLQTNG